MDEPVGHGGHDNQRIAGGPVGDHDTLSRVAWLITVATLARACWRTEDAGSVSLSLLDPAYATMNRSDARQSLVG